VIDELLKYLPTLTGFAKRLLNNHLQDAEDAIQDLSIRMWNKREFLSTIPFIEQKRYANTALVNICTDYHRRSKSDSNPRKKGNADELNEVVYLKPDEVNLYDKVEQKQHIGILYDAILTLKSKTHKEMLLMFLNGYKCCEIAEIFKTSINNVTSGIRYAKLKLKKKLAA